jgi:hypothetical protein
MIDHVLGDFPHYPEQLVERSINDHVQKLIAKRPWSGLTQYGLLAVPDEVRDGTVDTTLGSNVVTGTATGWPVDDKTNTTVDVATTEIGIIEMKPVSMTDIEEGIYLLIDGGGAAEEAVFVLQVNANTGTFQADFANTHLSTEAITRSSLTNLQFRTDFNAPFVTVVAVTSSTRLLLDKEWANGDATGTSYTIALVFASFGRDLKWLYTVVNLTRRFQLIVNYTKQVLDFSDPQRAATQSTFMAVFHATDPGGSPLFELYPRPLTDKAFPYFYIKVASRMTQDNEFLPNGIRSDVVVKRVEADAFRWAQHKKVAGGIYYDPGIARDLVGESHMEIEEMAQDDDNTHIMRMMWDYRNWPMRLGSEFWQSHDADSFYGNI